MLFSGQERLQKEREGGQFQTNVLCCCSLKYHIMFREQFIKIHCTKEEYFKVKLDIYFIDHINMSSLISFGRDGTWRGGGGAQLSTSNWGEGDEGDKKATSHACTARVGVYTGVHGS